MPVHDWTRVNDGIFHHFHYCWVLEIKRSLIRGLLPSGYYIMAEQHGTPDVLARTLLVRHSSNDHLVAMIEVLSPGNKSSRHAFWSFLDKSVAALDGGIHLLLIDVHPPSPRDPHGIHGAVLNEIGNEEYALPEENARTVVSYIGGTVVEAFVAHFAVNEPLPSMPLFLTRENYVHVPLETTYMAAWQVVPPQFQRTLTTT